MAAGYQTISDIYDQLLEALNKTNNGSIDATEFESLANEVQLKLVKNFYADVERIQKRIDDLASLVTPPTLLIPTALNTFDLSNAAVTASGKLIDLNPVVPGRYGFMFLLNATVQLNYKGNKCYKDGVQNPEVWVKSKPLKTDFTYSLEEDYYNRPTDERPYHAEESNGADGKQIRVVTNTPSNAYRLKIQYVKYPRMLLLANNNPGDIDLPISMREELVRMMVVTYLERIESRRFQSNAALETKNFS